MAIHLGSHSSEMNFTKVLRLIYLILSIIIKSEIEENKMKALIQFLKSSKIDAEIRKLPEIKIKKEAGFSLSAGIWKDYNIEANKLRQEVWNIK